MVRNRPTNPKCTTCDTPLTADNAGRYVWAIGVGRCKECAAGAQKSYYHKQNAIKRQKHRKKLRNGSKRLTPYLQKKYVEVTRFSLKHSVLKGKLRREGVSENDPLYSFNFYREFIREFKCHYCFGPLQVTGHSLDRKENSIQYHTAFNVVPCCKACNTFKSYYVPYDTMLSLRPTIILLKNLQQTADQIEGEKYDRNT